MGKAVARLTTRAGGAAAMTDDARRGTPAVTQDQHDTFLAQLRKTANVSASARVAGFDRKTAYRHRDADKDFADDWDDALREAVDGLRETAFKIANGVEEVVVSMGKIVYNADKSAMTRTVYDSATLRFLMQAHDPSYRPQPPAPAPVDMPEELLPDPIPEGDEPGPDSPIL